LLLSCGSQHVHITQTGLRVLSTPTVNRCCPTQPRSALRPTQLCVLHSCTFTIGPHFDAVPLNRLRVCIWVPPAQLLEHAPQFVHAENVQEPSHAVEDVHACCWIKTTPAHAALVFSRPGGMVKRVRVCLPAPQLASHGDHTLQSDTGQVPAGTEGHSASDVPHSRCM
jgi:hypothetical protein